MYSLQDFFCFCDGVFVNLFYVLLILSDVDDSLPLSPSIYTLWQKELAFYFQVQFLLCPLQQIFVLYGLTLDKDMISQPPCSHVMKKRLFCVVFRGRGIFSSSARHLPLDPWWRCNGGSLAALLDTRGPWGWKPCFRVVGQKDKTLP